MREIKFRAWIKDERRMVVWHLEFFSDMSTVMSYGSGFPYDEEDVILMQSTGLKDIYDHDIVRVPKQDGEYDIGIVYWCEGLGQWGVEFSDGEWEPLWEFDLEVIGNIHANPDLLKGNADAP